LFPWSGHESYTYLVVKSLNLNLDKLVEIRPYTYKETRVYNTKYYYTDDFAGQRKFFDPLNDGKFPPDPSPVDGKLPAWQILTIYAQFPDFGMDEELNLSPLQSLIGNSQGVRHIDINWDLSKHLRVISRFCILSISPKRHLPKEMNIGVTGSFLMLFTTWKTFSAIP